MNSNIGFVLRVLEILEECGLNVEHIPTGIDTMSVVVHTDQLESCREKILTMLPKRIDVTSLTIDDGVALIAVVGRGMVKSKGVAARVFASVADANINIKMIDQGSSELNIILAVDENDYEKALRAIYNEFCN